MARRKGRFETYLDKTLDDVAVNEFGFMKVGTGNSVHNFIVQENLKHSIEVGFAVKARQGDTFSPTKVTANGVVVYDVNAGPQVVDPGHGVPVAHSGRAAWSIDLSGSSNINENVEGRNLQQLIEDDNFKFLFGIDLNPGKKVKMLWLTADYDETANPGGSHIVLRDKFGNPVIADMGGDSANTANSWNQAFAAAAIDSDPDEPGIQPYDFGPARFDFRFVVKNGAGHTIADLHTQVRVHDGLFDI